MRYRFGDYLLNADRRELRRGGELGELVHVEPQVFDLLVFMIKNRDRVISRKELIDAVWGTDNIVEDTTFYGRIRDARKAVGDSGDTQALIRTRPRQGVIFVGEVTEEGAEDPRPLASDAVPLPDKLNQPWDERGSPPRGNAEDTGPNVEQPAGDTPFADSPPSPEKTSPSGAHSGRKGSPPTGLGPWLIGFVCLTMLAVGIIYHPSQTPVQQPTSRDDGVCSEAASRFPANSCAEQEGEKYTVSGVAWNDRDKGLNVRALPNGPIVGVLPSNTTGITIEGGKWACEGIWCPISCRGLNLRGFSSRLFLAPQADLIRQQIAVSNANPEITIRNGPDRACSEVGILPPTPRIADDIIVHTCQPGPNDRSIHHMVRNLIGTNLWLGKWQISDSLTSPPPCFRICATAVYITSLVVEQEVMKMRRNAF